MKPITPTIHTVVDVLFCIAMAASPSLFGFGGTPASLCYGIAGSYFVFAMLTNTPMAPIKLIPFKVHGLVEIVAGIGLIAEPWVFRFGHIERAKWLFIGAGILTFIVFTLTQWREVPKPVVGREMTA